MTEKEIRFICAYADCKKETTIIVQIAKPIATQSKDIMRVYYCAHCNRANKVPVPDHLDTHQFILGKDKGFVGYTSGDIPLLQGEKDL